MLHLETLKTAIKKDIILSKCSSKIVPSGLILLLKSKGGSLSSAFNLKLIF